MKKHLTSIKLALLLIAPILFSILNNGAKIEILSYEFLMYLNFCIIILISIFLENKK